MTIFTFFDRSSNNRCQSSPLASICRSRPVAEYILSLFPEEKHDFFTWLPSPPQSILVCHGTSKLKVISTVVAMLIIWIGATVPNLTILSPTFFEITFHDDNDCAVHAIGPATYYVTHSAM